MTLVDKADLGRILRAQGIKMGQDDVKLWDFEACGMAFLPEDQIMKVRVSSFPGRSTIWFDIAIDNLTHWFPYLKTSDFAYVSRCSVVFIDLELEVMRWINLRLHTATACCANLWSKMEFLLRRDKGNGHVTVSSDFVAKIDSKGRFQFKS